MSILGTSGAQSAAGAPQAERAEAREARTPRQPARPARTADEYDTFVRNTESPEAVRSLAGNDQEQAHQDRREHPHYAPDQPPPDGTARKQIDVRG